MDFEGDLGHNVISSQRVQDRFYLFDIISTFAGDHLDHIKDNLFSDIDAFVSLMMVLYEVSLLVRLEDVLAGRIQYSYLQRFITLFYLRKAVNHIYLVFQEEKVPWVQAQVYQAQNYVLAAVWLLLFKNKLENLYAIEFY